MLNPLSNIQKCLIIFVVLLVCLAVGPAIPAGAEESPVFYGEEVIVTASHVPVKNNELPVSATVITSTEIDTFGARNLGDVIKLTFGTFPKTTGFLGSQVSGNIRGSSAQQILILVDGQRVNSPLLGGYDLGDLPTDNIERVEIVRGPVSALYGSDAIGGTINIITKKAPGENKAGIILAPTLMEMGANNVILSASGGNGEMDCLFSANSTGSPGYRENSDYTALKYSGDISGRLNDDASARFCFDVYNAKKGVPGSLTFPTPATRQEDNDRQFRLLTDEKINDRWDMKFNSSFDEMDQSFSADPDTTPYDRYNSYSSQYDLLNNFRIDPANELVLGAEYRDDRSRSTLSGTHLVTNKAYYLEDHLQLIDQLSMTASMRRDEHSAFGDVNSPRVGLVYELVKGLSLWTSYGESFRAPTLNDLYTYYVDPIWGTIMKGNRKLKPEKGNSTEIGVKWDASDSTRISANYFSNKVDDLIEWVDISGTWATWEPQNIASANICGYELGIDHYLYRDLKAFINYSGLIPVDTATGKDLVYRPREQYNAGLEYNDAAGDSAALFLRHVGVRFDNKDNSRSVDAYTTVNIKCTSSIAPRLQLEFGADNFLNEDYQDTFDYPMPGRIYSFGIKYNLL